MINVSKLKGKIVEKGMNQQQFAKYINIDRSTLYRKMANDSSFTVEEANKIVEVLDLTPEEALAIFFVQKLA